MSSGLTQMWHLQFAVRCSMEIGDMSGWKSGR